MAIESLAAIGLVSNIVQFVDFSCKTYYGAKEIYSSGSEASQKTQNLLLVTRDLKEICGQLRGQGSGRSTSASASLSGLAFECQKAGAELLDALEALTNQKPGSKWASFRVALLAVWKQCKIDEMGVQLDRCRSQLILRLQELQMSDNSHILSRLETIQQRSNTMSAQLDDQATQIKVTVLDAIQKLESEICRQQQEQVAKVNKKKIANKAPEAAQEVPTLTASLVLTSTTHLDFLRALCFENMAYRFGRVAEAYPKTFQWMFVNDFMDWLQSESSLFWISGKPGSGKSTLMRFLVEEHRTTQALQKWAGNQQLVVCNYFFWSNGTKMQRSDEGLLRSLLYHIFRQCPHLMKDSFPAQCASISAGHHEAVSWNRSDLVAGFQRLVQHNRGQARICIFIDGLDEYDGDCDELVDIVRSLGDTEDVKLCIASRPWNVFEAAFGGLQNRKQKLYLQDLNMPDIETYVQGKLESRADFCTLRALEPGADELVKEITMKSQGVFLWVYLVVRSLIQGLQNADRIVDLRRRLRAFPSDLNEFFSNIFQSLDEIYRVQVARSFQAALSVSRPLSLLNYYYLDIEETDPYFVEGMPTKTLPTARLREILDHMRARLNGRCKGLLEVAKDRKQPKPAFRFRVDFLHRTVKDFLLTRDMESLLKNWNEGFEPHLVLARTTLAEIKSVGFSSGSAASSQLQFNQLFDEFFWNLKEYEKKHKTSPEKLVDEMHKTLLALFPPHPTSEGAFSYFLGNGFLTLTIFWGLREYAKTKCRKGLVGNGSYERISMLRHTLNPALKKTAKLPTDTFFSGNAYGFTKYEEDRVSRSGSSSPSSIAGNWDVSETPYSFPSHFELEYSQTQEQKARLPLKNQPLELPDPELVRLLLEHSPAFEVDRAALDFLFETSENCDDDSVATTLELLFRAGAIGESNAIAAESVVRKYNPDFERLSVARSRPKTLQILPQAPETPRSTRRKAPPQPVERISSTKRKGQCCFWCF